MEKSGFLLDLEGTVTGNIVPCDVLVISDIYVDGLLTAYLNKSLYSGAVILLIELMNGNSVYITDKELYGKVKQLFDAKNYNLVSEMFNTIKEYENKELKDERIRKIKRIII